MEVLKAWIIHILVASIILGKRRQVKRACKHNQLEPKLIVVISNLSKFMSTNSIYTILNIILFEDLSYNNTNFLFDIYMIEMYLNKEKTNVEINHLQWHLIIAYFVGSCSSNKYL